MKRLLSASTNALRPPPTISRTLRTIQPLPTLHPPILTFTHPPIRTMSYESFLDHANRDVSAPTGATTTSTSTSSKKTQAVTAEVPQGLAQRAEGLWYTSEADEPWEVVALVWDGKGGLDEASFATLIDNPTTTALTRAEFDPTNQYAPVFDAVQQAAGSGAEIKIFRAEMDAGGRRAEYFVVGWDGEGGKVVGLRAVGVET